MHPQCPSFNVLSHYFHMLYVRCNCSFGNCSSSTYLCIFGQKVLLSTVTEVLQLLLSTFAEVLHILLSTVTEVLQMLLTTATEVLHMLLTTATEVLHVTDNCH